MFIPIILVIAIAGLFMVGIFLYSVLSAPTGTKKMQALAEAIYLGARTFLYKEYRMIVLFVLFVAVFLAFFINVPTAITFVIGSFVSALAGFLGMYSATHANVRTTHAARHSLSRALRIAFHSGAVMGFSVVSLGLLGIVMLYLIFQDTSIIFGFSLGASSIALFSRVGGGIFTKAADVGADLVGKVEEGIPEDDPRNPAVIADNVGDNVGDVAGMGADLFESYVGSIIASITLGAVLFSVQGVIIPLLIASAGLLASFFGVLFVNSKKSSDAGKTLFRSLLGTSFIFIFFTFLIFWLFYPAQFFLFWAVLSGLVTGLVIGFATNYYTSETHRPVHELSLSSKTGVATNIISGFSLGMRSTVIPIICITFSIFLSYTFGGLFGISLAAVGMLSTLAISLAIDAYGPVADNAGGIAEMAHLAQKVRTTTDHLDMVGNTTAAMGKGFAIGSAALTSLALFSAFVEIAGLDVISLTNHLVIIGLLLGACLPFVFSSMTMDAVGKAAYKIVEEVRRQFRRDSRIMKGTTKPDYEACVGIATNAALLHMVLPATIAIVMPLIVGVMFGPAALGGLLAGALSSGILLAIMMANSGGAWDNAKKYIEEGHFGGKGSVVHKASVVGDTVGDPFKDTSGPSLNILIKLMSIVALVGVPLFL
jgi:K(+)-stimulated pyrophosphate-energized sodium pump